MLLISGCKCILLPCLLWHVTEQTCGCHYLTEYCLWEGSRSKWSVRIRYKDFHIWQNVKNIGMNRLNFGINPYSPCSLTLALTIMASGCDKDCKLLCFQQDLVLASKCLQMFRSWNVRKLKSEDTLLLFFFYIKYAFRSCWCASGSRWLMLFYTESFSSFIVQSSAVKVQ